MLTDNITNLMLGRVPTNTYCFLKSYIQFLFSAPKQLTTEGEKNLSPNRFCFGKKILLIVPANSWDPASVQEVWKWIQSKKTELLSAQQEDDYYNSWVPPIQR